MRRPSISYDESSFGAWVFTFAMMCYSVLLYKYTVYADRANGKTPIGNFLHEHNMQGGTRGVPQKGPAV